MKNALESLKSAKFEAFKGMEISNPLLVKGGNVEPTTWVEYDRVDHPTGAHGTDEWRTGNDAFGTPPFTAFSGEVGDMVVHPMGPPPHDPNDPNFWVDYQLESWQG